MQCFRLGGFPQPSSLPWWEVLAYAALPLALAGLAPWPVTALLCLIFGLGAAAPALMPLQMSASALVIGGAGLLGMWGAMQAGNTSFLIAAIVMLVGQLLGVAAVQYAAQLTLEGSKRAWLLLLLPILLAPQPLALISLAAAALLRPGRDSGALPQLWQGPGARPALLWLGGAAAAAVLLGAALLPQTSLWGQMLHFMGQQQHITGEVVQQVDQYVTPPSPDAGKAAENSADLPAAPPSAGQFDRAAETLENVLAGLILLVWLGFFLRLWRTTGGKAYFKWPRSPIELLWLLGLPVFALALLLAAQYRAVTADLTVTEEVRQLPLPAPDLGSALGERLAAGPGDAINLLFLTAGSVLLAALFVAAWALFAGRSGPPVGSAAPASAAEPPPARGTPAIPLHRVRRAYAQAEAHLASLGFGRGQGETPSEFLARAARQWPGAAGALATLAEAYAPVRYGGGISEAAAEEAEQAAAVIVQLALAPPGGAAP